MMRAIGEMLYYDPDQHTFINFITKYVGKDWGYFSGWSYWLSLIFLGMAEITAVATYVQYWFPAWPAWIIQIVFLILLSSINLIAVRVFGETEFWFAMIKIIAILALIATGIFMVLTDFKTSQGHASLSNITNHFEFFLRAGQDSLWPFKWSSSPIRLSNLSELLPQKHKIPEKSCLRLFKKFPFGLSSSISVP